MRRWSVAGWCVLALACGRVGFQPLAGDAPPSYGPHVDAPHGDTPTSIDAASAPASCIGLPASCGPTGAPCCDSRLVVGGPFLRGDDLGSDGMNNDTADPATVGDYRLDTYEVTVGRFRQFVAAGQGTQAQPPAPGAAARTLNGSAAQGGWDPAWNANLTADSAALASALHCNNRSESWTDAAGSNERLPIQCVTWFEAFAFCAWDGGFLPTDAEWNYAAAGGSDQRAYPWSSPPQDLTIDCTYADYELAQGSGSGSADAYCSGSAIGLVQPVGTESPRGDGKFGQVDLAGNVWEWTLDVFVSPYPRPCDDCAYLGSGSFRVLRGGGDGDPSHSLRTAVRHFGMPTARASDTGLRCARAP